MNIRLPLALLLAVSATATRAQDQPVFEFESVELDFDPRPQDLSNQRLFLSVGALGRHSWLWPRAVQLSNDVAADFDTTGARGSDLSSRIVQTQYSVPSASYCHTDGCCPQFGSSGCGEGCSSDCYPLFTGSVEIPFLRARLSGAAPVFNVSPGAQRLVDPNYDPAVRYVAELRPEESFGIRGRYFRYDHTFSFDPPFQPAELGIALDTADLEFVFHRDSCRWSFDFSAGLEYGKLQYSADIATAVIGAGRTTFEGLGPVFGLNAEHALGDTNLSFFGSVRASFLMGSINNSALLINMPRAEIKDEMAQVYQNQLGVVWQPKLSGRVDIAVRAAWETQFWLNETFSDDSFGIGSNLSLTGPMVSAELSF